MPFWVGRRTLGRDLCDLSDVFTSPTGGVIVRGRELDSLIERQHKRPHLNPLPEGEEIVDPAMPYPPYRTPSLSSRVCPKNEIKTRISYK
jgi:hypothetical protein